MDRLHGLLVEARSAEKLKSQVVAGRLPHRVCGFTGSLSREVLVPYRHCKAHGRLCLVRNPYLFRYLSCRLFWRLLCHPSPRPSGHRLSRSHICHLGAPVLRAVCFDLTTPSARRRMTLRGKDQALEVSVLWVWCEQAVLEKLVDFASCICGVLCHPPEESISHN